MKTTIIPFNSNQAFSMAVETLQKNGVIAFPTDTVYGVGCSLWNPEAIEKVFIAKDRSKDKPLPILIGNLKQIEEVAAFDQINPSTQALMQHFWPGAMTVIVPKHASIPENLSPFDTVGVRMPNHPRLLQLLTITGPLAVTSANRSGESNPTTAGEVFAQLGNKIELILDGGRTESEVPSTVIASTPDGYSILRQGAITREEIAAILR